ncbi:MAG: CHAD domain-containing protein [Rivularia sp. (in: Bacteria)]|nr:CHAD domain-containing protein [Rivularia sp. MS3]
MAYRLENKESIGAEIRRIAYEQTDKAIDKLTEEFKNDNIDSLSNGLDVNERTEIIHDVRKAIKKIRAVIRLVRDELGEEVYKQENHCFRDAGRNLSEVRDAQVLLETFNKLEKHFAEFIKPEGFVDLQQILVEHYQSTCKRVLEQNTVLEVLADIKNARERISNWSLELSYGRSILSNGLQRVYKRGYQACQSILKEDEPTVENFHDWRKRVKYLWYHLRIVRPIWSDLIKEWTNQTKQLGKYLGDDHDLAVLHEFINNQQEMLKNQAELEVLNSLINRRRKKLQSDAKSLGQRIYVESPELFVNRIEAYWQIWQVESQQLT